MAVKHSLRRIGGIHAEQPVSPAAAETPYNTFARPLPLNPASLVQALDDQLSLEAPEPGTVCPVCGRLLDVVAYCPECYERLAWEAAEVREGGNDGSEI